MFKKPLADWKTSAPIRNSDRRKLKQRVQEAFSLEADIAELLVPDGLRSVKFSTHLDQPGIAYLSSNSEPLWFTIGKGSDDMIPTVYTLWKHFDLLPYLSTPAAVIPKLISGADLMAPGVVQASSEVQLDQLVCVTQYHKDKRGPPLAIGRMAVSADQLRAEDAKGKALLVFHTWKDKLWELGGKSDPPDPIDVQSTVVSGSATQANGDGNEAPNETNTEASSSVKETSPPPDPSGGQSGLSPEEVSDILRSALLQAIESVLKDLPSSAYPIPATTFYTTYLLPARPAFITGATDQSDDDHMTPVDIKHSSHKSLTTFLKAAEKENLLTLKSPPKGKGDVQVTTVNATHPDVVSHRRYKSLEDKEERDKKRDAAQKAADHAAQIPSRIVVELWKPHQNTVKLFEEAKQDTSALYTLSDLKAILNSYVEAKDIVNKQERQYVDVARDDALSAGLASKNDSVPEFMKREELLKRLADKMQPWYRLELEGKDAILKKGRLSPIDVTVKIRQGRKACTLITGFEPFLLEADDLAEELRHACASSTAVAPVAGKNAGLEVMVQGQQIKAVTDLLTAKGVLSQWIHGTGSKGKK